MPEGRKQSDQTASGKDRGEAGREEGAPRRGLIGRAARVWSYGFTRPFGDARASARSVGAQWREMRERTARTRAQREQAQAEYAQRAEGLTPSQRFAAEAERGGWSAAELAQQQRAARVARRSALVMCVAGFLFFGACIVYSPPFMAIIFSLLAMAVLVSCVVLAIRYAWWEFELQGRVLVPLGQFLSRADLFRRLLS